jgi:hypothetical protein
LVTLQDGSTVAGRWAYPSFASSDPLERDLYLDYTYNIDDDGVWHDPGRQRAMWIPGPSIAHIAFFANAEHVRHGGRTYARFRAPSKKEDGNA